MILKILINICKTKVFTQRLKNRTKVIEANGIINSLISGSNFDEPIKTKTNSLKENIFIVINNIINDSINENKSRMFKIKCAKFLIIYSIFDNEISCVLIILLYKLLRSGGIVCILLNVPIAALTDRTISLLIRNLKEEVPGIPAIKLYLNVASFLAEYIHW